MCCLRAATLVTAIVLAKWFYRVKPVAGYLLWPYVAFLTFANALNWCGHCFWPMHVWVASLVSRM